MLGIFTFLYTINKDLSLKSRYIFKNEDNYIITNNEYIPFNKTHDKGSLINIYKTKKRSIYTNMYIKRFPIEIKKALE